MTCSLVFCERQLQVALHRGCFLPYKAFSNFAGLVLLLKVSSWLLLYHDRKTLGMLMLFPAGAKCFICGSAWKRDTFGILVVNILGVKNDQFAGSPRMSNM